MRWIGNKITKTLKRSASSGNHIRKFSDHLGAKRRHKIGNLWAKIEQKVTKPDKLNDHSTMKMKTGCAKIKTGRRFLRATLKRFLNVQSLKPDTNNINFDRTLKIIGDTNDRKLWFDQRQWSASEMTIWKSSGERREGIYKTMVMEGRKSRSKQPLNSLNSAALTLNAALYLKENKTRKVDDLSDGMNKRKKLKY